MYVLLNLKDGSRLTDVVQLLFSHGHTAVSVAENIEDLCPTCERRNNHKTSGAEHNDDPPITKSLLHEAKSDKLSTPAQLLGKSPKGESIGTAMAREPDGEQLITKTDHVPPPEPAQIKEEPSEFTVATTSSAEPTSNTDNAPFSITSALELLGHAAASTMAENVQDQGDAELDKEHNGPPSKRKARIEYLGLETFQCQLCKKAITRQGQYANLVNHLSRHARLHASKKQYCCPVCRASFSRRYLAYAHVKEAHPSAGHVEPLDHGRELREEYRALLEVCFPGASSRRKRNIDHDSHDKGAEEDAHDAERSGVLSKLLEQQ